MSHMRELAEISRKVTHTTQDCESLCIDTIQHCMEMGGAHVTPAHIQLLQDCADICQTTARFASRRSMNQDNAAAVCAEICELCAASCAKFVTDPQMKACANQCLLCAVECRELVRSDRAAMGAERSHGVRRGFGHTDSQPG